jgi:hypothetical protein
MGIVKFEFKYVDKLNCGASPGHKKFLENLSKKRILRNICYTVGILIMAFPLILLMIDTICVNKSASLMGAFKI